MSSGHQLMTTQPLQAIRQFEQARDLFAELGDVCEAAVAENWAVQFLLDMGQVAEGRLRLTSLLASAEDRQFKIIVVPVHYWRGYSDYQQKRFSESNKNFKLALRLAETADNIFEVQHAADALNSNYSDLGELEPALSYASKMVSAKGIYYESSNQLLRDLGTLADLSLKLRFFSTSLSFAREGLSIAQEISATNSRVNVNANLHRLENIAEASGDLTAALNYANQSKEFVAGLHESDENTQTRARTFLLLAGAKSKAKNCAEALTDYDTALALFLRHPEITDNLYQLHKGKLFCYQQLERHQDFDDELKTVFALSEEYRATIREDDSRQAFFANEQDVFDTATANAIQKHDSLQALEFVEKSRARSLLDFIESDQPIAKLEKSFGLVTQPLSLAEIQARLPEQVQLVEYAVLPDKLAIWVVSRTQSDLVEKQITARELEARIAAYHTAIVHKDSQIIEQAGRELYQLLIPPGLAADKQLCLVPDKSLHQLAFASLISPAGKYLLQEFALFYAPSASVMVVATANAAQKERNGNERVLSVGNPDFDREENPGLADLRDAADEAKDVAAAYNTSLELLGASATKEAFLRDFTNVEVIHFAGHFVANRQSPANSKLLFAGGDLRSSELGFYKLPLAKLVVLSACKTGFERYDKSEGAIGIARTFLALGAPIVVATQWKVDSERTRELMNAFHHQRKQGHLTTAEGLRQAQLEMLGRDETKAPFYWAAFSLFGGYANY
jgi:CHAT domain-containing protein